ncbi:MAG: amidohydrolase family protein [Rhodospirillales bacterium]|nr:MAG: amidohydrolase family protein [Rhodospirillales bacterium]
MTYDRRAFIRHGAGALAGLWLAGSGRAFAQQAGAETIVFRNGVVLPVDAGFSQHAALAIRGNRVLAVGSNEAVVNAAGRGARIIDLEGRTVLPGFIEPHMHFALLAAFGHTEDVGPFKQPTFDACLKALRKVADNTGANDWIVARQFDPVLLEPSRELTTKELDEISRDRPIFVLNASGHIAYVNSKSLELAKITKDTPDPKGAEYGRYEDGSPNGVLYGVIAHLPVMLLNEAIVTRMETGIVDAGIEVGEQAATHGITTLCDMAAGAFGAEADIEAFEKMFAVGRMKARVRAYLFDGKAEEWDKAGAEPGYGDAFMRVSGWKMVVDGSNQGYTGRQREPYIGRDSKGIFYVEPKVLNDHVLKRAKQGWPLALHGNGDAAIDAILDSLENAQRQGVDIKSLRCRIEHCSILHDDQIARCKALGVGPSFLINHVHYWGHVMRDKVFGPKKVQLLDRCGAVEAAGLTWTMHTDAPVSPLGSLHKIRVAVARDLWKEPETVLAPQERIGVETAIRSITRDAAWLSHSENEIGSLEPGKLADLVLLESDPRKVEPRTISDIKVSQTWMDGKQVYGD